MAASKARKKAQRSEPNPRAREEIEAGQSAAVWTPLNKLKGWAKNPRKNQDTIWRVVSLVIAFGWGRPVGARKANGELIWGHSATAAAYQLKKEWEGATAEQRERWSAEAVTVATKQIIPVRFMTLEEEKAHGLAIADNRAQEFSQWDQELLAESMSEMSLGQAHLMGWSPTELEKMSSHFAGPDQQTEEPEQLGENGYQHVSQCGVIVMAKDEAQQEQIFNKLSGMGYECRVVNV